MLLDEPDRARPYFEQTYANARSNVYILARTRWKTRCLIGMAELSLRQGDVGGAQRFLIELKAQGFTEGFPFRKHVARLRRLQAAIALHEGAPELAEDRLREALAAADSVGNPVQIWRTHDAFRRLYAERGAEADASAHGQTAFGDIESMATGLSDEELRRTFLDAKPIRAVIYSAGRSLR